MRKPILLFFLAALCVGIRAAVPVEVIPVKGAHGMVVAGHPQAAAIGVEVLKRGGNAIDAAVAVSLAVGVAEPDASGLGGKLMRCIVRRGAAGPTPSTRWTPAARQSTSRPTASCPTRRTVTATAPSACRGSRPASGRRIRNGARDTGIGLGCAD
jgi:hypothetical protein